MAANQPSYVLAPNWDFPPDRDIRLGNIIKDPKLPGRSLNSESRIDPNQDPESPHAVTTTKKQSWSLTRHNLLSLNAGLQTSFLAPLIGFGGDVAGRAFRDDEARFKCQTLETQYFNPSDRYIAESLSSKTVKAYTKKYWWKSIYMITGVKIAHGASIETFRNTGYGADVAVTTDLTPFMAVPVGEKPHFSSETTHEHHIVFDVCEEPFIIGYQLLKIKPKSDGNFADKSFNKFALLSDEQIEDATSKEAVELLHQVYNIGHVEGQDDIDGETTEIWCAPGLFDCAEY